jgi:hypothetical protein
VSAQPPQWQQPQGRPPSPQQGQQQRPPQGPQWGPQQGPPRAGGSPPGGRRANTEPERAPASRKAVGSGRVALAAGVSVVLLIAMFSAVTWAAFAAAKERERIAAQPSPTPYSVPKSADPTTPPPKGVLAELPDICAKLQTALTSDLRPGQPDHGKANDKERQSCRWHTLDKQQATYLTVDLVVYPDSDPATAIATADQELDEEKDYAADTKSNGGFHKNVQDVTGVGDKAFGDVSSNIITSDEVNYHVAGAHLFARSGNVTIEVNWLGATYPESQNVKVLRGTDLTYDEALPKAKQVVETAMGQLR